MEHTPGGWSISSENCAGGVNVMAGEVRIAHTNEVARWAGRPVSCDEAKANARLIAAAPCLLEMVRRYASECAECDGSGLREVMLSSVIRETDCTQCADIRALIAKASGENLQQRSEHDRQAI